VLFAKVPEVDCRGRQWPPPAYLYIILKRFYSAYSFYLNSACAGKGVKLMAAKKKAPAKKAKKATKKK